MTFWPRLLGFPALLLTAQVVHAASTPPSVQAALRAGAARVEITPPTEELPTPYRRVHDPLYVRALVIDNGSTRAAFVVADVPMIQAAIRADLIARIAALARAPVEQVLVNASHTHNSIRVDADSSGGIITGSDSFVRRVTAGVLQSVREAVSAMQPARAGYATGKAWLVANRNEWSVTQHRYIEGIDRSDPQSVDPTLGVFKFESLTGEPLAFLLNYPMEPVVDIAQKDEISGDVPGATARYVEDHFAGKAVALFTIGPANSPKYRTRPDPVTGRNDSDRSHRVMTAMATILGEEVLAASGTIERPTTQLPIAGALDTLQCPGKITRPQNLPNECAYTSDSKLPACVFKDEDAPAVTLSYGLLRLGDVAFVHADANVVPAMGERLKRASPLANTLVMLENFGPFRYVVDDASYPLNTYEATATRAKQGCAEQGFVDGALGLLQRLR